MTTTLERYKAPSHRQAVTLISLIASPLFHAAEKFGPASAEGERLFDVWFQVKERARSIDDAKSLDIDPQARADLFAAAELAHSQAHSPGAVTPAARCYCSIARHVNALSAVFEAHDAHVPA